MDVSMLDAAWQALVIMSDPWRLGYLGIGVVIGLVLGIMPGLGGVSGMALLLPFTYGMDPYAAFAFLLGLGAVTSTGDTIPAVLFGVPGTAGAQATVIDGHPLAKKGEAGRALAAAYMASLLGGLAGALILGLSIPVLRPIMLYIGSPELLAFAIFGISMVAVLSGSAPLRGIAAAGVGLMLSFMGSDPQTGTLRWTFGTLYLYDGLPLLPVALGIFALPELADLAIKRAAIAAESRYDVKRGMLKGAADAFRHWWLVLRCGMLGAAVGAIPGLGSAVVDWFAYGHAVRTEKGASKTFGKGDIRGVIAPESANNAKEGGSLVPTIAFGVPGSASMAILLGAFLIHGLVPGPDMLTRHLDVTYSMVWSVAIANVLGAGLCFAFSGQFAKIATLRWTLILPAVLTILYIGAYQGSRDWGDFYALLAFGVLGWTMKRLRWPRPPLILGFVLGAIIERYMFISTTRYGWEWLSRPIVAVLLILAVVGLFRPLIEDWLASRRENRPRPALGRPTFRPRDLFYVLLIVFFAALIWQTKDWNPAARIAPMAVGWLALAATSIGLAGQIFRRPTAEMEGSAIHMDVASDTGDAPERTVIQRAVIFFGYLVFFIASTALVGLIPTAFLLVVLFMRLENSEPWRIVLPMAAGIVLFIWVLFDQLLGLLWPPALLGDWIPALQVIPSV